MPIKYANAPVTRSEKKFGSFNQDNGMESLPLKVLYSIPFSSVFEP